MRVYFLSSEPAALKLDGVIAGYIDLFERYIELPPQNTVLVEVVPNGNLQPINFILGEKFFDKPHDFADIYISKTEKLIFFRKFENKSCSLAVIAQQRFEGELITIFRQGGIYAACDGGASSLYELPAQFCKVKLSLAKICGNNFLCAEASSFLALFSSQGKMQLFEKAESYSLGDRLTITEQLESCTRAKAELIYNYDGEKFILESREVTEDTAPDPRAAHFAFFESVLFGADCRKYLSEELKDRAGALKSYLGDFCAVVPPLQSFYDAHGYICAAGLIYKKQDNFYEVKYFVAEMSDGEVKNIYPA